MQRCSAVLTAETNAQLSFWVHVLPLAVFCQPQPLACILRTHVASSCPAGPCSKAGTLGGRPGGYGCGRVVDGGGVGGEEPMPLGGHWDRWHML